MKDILNAVFARELTRLDDKSKLGPLDLDDLKALDLLTRSLKSYQEPTKQAENPLKDLTNEQLVALMRLPEIDDERRPEAKPKAKIARAKQNAKKRSKQPTMAKR